MLIQHYNILECAYIPHKNETNLPIDIFNV